VDFEEGLAFTSGLLLTVELKFYQLFLLHLIKFTIVIDYFFDFHVILTYLLLDFFYLRFLPHFLIDGYIY
jgi:hypothetical protein